MINLLLGESIEVSPSMRSPHSPTGFDESFTFSFCLTLQYEEAQINSTWNSSYVGSIGSFGVDLIYPFFVYFLLKY